MYSLRMCPNKDVDINIASTGIEVNIPSDITACVYLLIFIM